MPFYDTKCPNCGEEEEQYHPVHTPHNECPKCNIVMTQVFKGKFHGHVKGGWMAEDFKYDGHTKYDPNNYKR